MKWNSVENILNKAFALTDFFSCKKVNINANTRNKTNEKDLKIGIFQNYLKPFCCRIRNSLGYIEI